MAKPIKGLELHYLKIQFFYNIYLYIEAVISIEEKKNIETIGSSIIYTMPGNMK